MEEDEDTYGFGSFSELFDAGAAQATKRLDLGALSRFCMSERLLSRFQQQQQRRRRDRRGAMFQHVAAKFNGVGIEGGLGTLSVATLEGGGGVVWLQTTQSDSDALERRKKELQDITNHAPPETETKSAAALFVAVKHVATVLPTTVQNTVQGVEIKLTDGNKLELTFMPGPFAGATHRDEFLQALKKCLAVAEDDEKEASVGGVAASTPSKSERNSVATSDKKEEVGDEALLLHVDSEVSEAAQRENFRQLVRRYTMVDSLSDEGIEIAKQVHAGTGYHLGPTTKQLPKFAADSEYRKKTVAELTCYLKRMNQEWSEADSHREQHMKARHSRNDDDLFEYTDTVTGAQIPVRAYEQRYLEYVKAHDVNPVLHLCPVQGERAEKHTSALNGALDVQQSAPATSPTVTEEEARNASEFFIASIGVDISKSCIIEQDFFSTEPEYVPVSRNGEDPDFRAAVDRKRAEIWKSWGDTFARVCRSTISQDDPPQRRPLSRVAQKRSRERRRSLVLPSSEELRSSVDANVPKSSEQVSHIATEGDSARPGAKRGRSTMQKSGTAQKTRRKARRQSIVSALSLPPTPSEAERKKTPRSRITPQSARKSPRPKHSSNGYCRETSALEMVGDEDAGLCQLCYGDQALVHMNPCDHAVCASCWSRLSPSLGGNGSSSRRVCPWDREAVTKRQDDGFGLQVRKLCREEVTRMRAAGCCEENLPRNRAALAPTQASAAVNRLLQWKKRNDAKRQVKAKLQEAERVEEEEYYRSLPRPLPPDQVQAAAIRNYQAAEELRWKKLMLQVVAEQQRLDEEIECTFRPRLVARPRRAVRSTETVTTKCRSSCAASAEPTKLPSRRPRQAPAEGKEDVFERLYVRQPLAVVDRAAAQDAPAVAKQISIETETAFVARQERDHIERQRRRAQLAKQQRFPHKPRLSRHTLEICLAMRQHETDKLADRCQRQRKRFDSRTQHRYTVPPSSSSSCSKSDVASRPFSLLVEALRQQELRMRCVTKCA